MEGNADTDVHCAMEGCYTVDLLPINCDICANRFCKVHATPDAHACTAQTSITTSKEESQDNRRITCAFAGCSDPTPFFKDQNQAGDSPQVSCTECAGAFCLKHRHQTDHNCSKLKEPQSSSSKSQELTKKAIANVKTSSSIKTKTTDPAKLAKIRAVELMKLRRKAEAANPRDQTADVPMDQRVFVTVSYDGNAEKVLWVRKDVVAGKALDLFAAKLGILTSPLSLIYEDNPLRTDLLLSDQVESPAQLRIEKKT